jgi:uncharacterized protein
MQHFQREIATWTRWIHIYLSMFSFAALLFFATTGITLNHPEWIEGQQKTVQIQGDLSVSWVHADSARINELMVVEFLRTTNGIKAPLLDFRSDATECSVSFKGPGYAAEGIIDRRSGHYELTITKSGLLAIMNDLHKGRDSGKAWVTFIDVSAVLMILVSLTGFLMIFFLKKKRFSGLMITAIGAVIIIAIYIFLV